MPAILLALAAAMSFGGSDFTAGLAARRASVLRVAVVAQVTNAFVLMSIVPFVSAWRLPSSSLEWAVGAGVSGVVGAIALYLGFRYAPFSVASPVSAVGAAAFSILAGLLLGERPGALSLAGIALALPAIAAVSASASRVDASQANDSAAATPSAGENGTPKLSRRVKSRASGRQAAGVGCGLIAGAGFGLFLIGLNRAGSATDLWPLAIAELTALVTVVCLAALTRQLGLPPAGTRGLSMLTGVIAATGSLFYFLATHRGLLAVTAVIYALYPAGTILLARAVLGERLATVRAVGLCLAAASIGLIAAGGAA